VDWPYRRRNSIHSCFGTWTWLILCATWLIYVCDIVTWFLNIQSPFRCSSFLFWYADMTRFVCDLTHSRLWHDMSHPNMYSPFGFNSFLFWYADMTHILCDMTPTYVWHDPLICMRRLDWMHSRFRAQTVRIFCETWLIHVCDMTP